MPEDLSERLRKRSELMEQQRKKQQDQPDITGLIGTGAKPPATPPKPPAAPPPADQPPRSLEERLKARSAQMAQERKQQQVEAEKPLYERLGPEIGGFAERFGLGALAGVTRHGATVADFMREQLAARSPAYRRRLEELQRKWEAATPEQRRAVDPRTGWPLMQPPFFLQSPEVRQVATPPPGVAGTLGESAESLVENMLAAYLAPEIGMGGLVGGALRVGEQAAIGGTLGGIQTGTRSGAEWGAILGGAGGLLGEYARAKAPTKFEQATTPYPGKPGARRTMEIMEVAKRATKPRDWVPLTRAEELKGFPSLRAEITRNKALIDQLTKQDPVYSSRTVPIDRVMGVMDRYIRQLRRIYPNVADSLEEQKAVWMKELGYQAPTATSPGVTTTTVKQLQEFKELLGEIIPNREWEKNATTLTEVMGATGRKAVYRGIKREIEAAIPEKAIKDLNHIIEIDTRVKEAVSRAVAKNPQWMGKTLGSMLAVPGLEAADRIFFEQSHKRTQGAPGGWLTASETGLFIYGLVSLAERNPRAYTRLLVQLQQGGAGLPAGVVAGFRDAFFPAPLPQPTLPGAEKKAPAATPPVQTGRETSPPARGATLVPALAEAIQRHEGWHAGSVSQRNNNPGNLKPLPNQYLPGMIGRDREGFAKFRDYDAGWNALLAQVQLNVNRGFNLNEFFAGKPGVYAGYAPAGDFNQPLDYAATVGGWLGIDPRRPLSALRQ